MISSPEKLARAAIAEIDTVGEWSLSTAAPIINPRIQDTQVDLAKEDTIDTNSYSYSLVDLADMCAQTNTFEPGDIGNAQRFVILFGDKFRFVAERDLWYTFNGSIWIACKQNEAYTAIVETIAAIKEEINYAEALVRGTEDKSPQRAHLKLLKLHYKKSSNNAQLKAALECAKYINTLKLSTALLDNHAYKFNALNGTIDLHTGEVSDFEKSDYLTIASPFNIAETSDCPIWKKTVLDCMCGDIPLADHLQKVFGAALLGEPTREQEFYMLFGGGSNGKSTLINVILALFGSYGTATSAEMWLDQKFETSAQATPEVANLIGKRFLAGAEIKEYRGLNEALLKAVTGGDALIARSLYKDPVSFRAVGTPFLSANHKPHISATNHAMWRRIRLIPFAANFEESGKDIHLEHKLKEEYAEIFRWLVEGTLRYLKEGLSDLPEAIKDANRAYRDEMDTIGEFLNDVVVEDKGSKIPEADLYKQYEVWAKAAGFNKPMFRKNFKKELVAKGYENGRNAAGGIWLNIRVKDFSF